MTEAIRCTRCGRSVQYPNDATTWIARAEFMDRLTGEGWSADIGRRLCPECGREAVQ